MGRTIWIANHHPALSSEFMGQPFVSVDQIHWVEDDGGVVVLKATAGLVERSRQAHDRPSQIQIIPRPHLFSIKQSLVGTPGEGFEEEPGGREEITLKGLHHRLTMQRRMNPSYEARASRLVDTPALTDTSSPLIPRDITVVGNQIGRLLEALGKNQAPLSGSVSAVIEAALGSYK